MGIKFKLTPEPVWIKASDPLFDKSELGEFSKDERDKVSFLINPLTDEVYSELRERYTTEKVETVFVQGRRETQRTTQVDNDGLNEALIDYIVKDWKGVVDEKERELPCTRENKLALVKRGYPMLGVAWIEASRMVMSQFEDFCRKYKEEQEKNLSNLQSGSGGDSKG